MATNEDRLLEAKEYLGLEGSELVAWALLELSSVLYGIAYGDNHKPGALEAIAMSLGYRNDAGQSLASALGSLSETVQDILETTTRVPD